ncbi:transposase [Mesorhizobium loti]|uniref:Transposase n=1 Tax=Rhizobium loti TaxID=381 RepID=A0A101KNU6_RHILI|nr:transposase [Mesorhizobium loti]
MGKSYSSDLRDRVVAFVAAGGSRRGAARQFGVSDSFAVKLLERSKRFGSSLPARQGRPPGRGKLAPHRAFLVGLVDERGDITMPELAARLAAERGVKALPSSLSRFLLQAGFTYKKSADGIGTRTRARP